MDIVSRYRCFAEISYYPRAFILCVTEPRRRQLLHIKRQGNNQSKLRVEKAEHTKNLEDIRAETNYIMPHTALRIVINRETGGRPLRRRTRRRSRISIEATSSRDMLATLGEGVGAAN